MDPQHRLLLEVLYALKHLANLQSNETILIQSAAGGVGQAAIMLTKNIGQAYSQR